MSNPIPTHELFRVHMLNQAGVAAAQELAQEFSRLAFWVEQRLPPSRERSIVLTHLQDASFHAKRGLAEMSELQAGVVASAGDFQLGSSTSPDAQKRWENRLAGTYTPAEREAAGGPPAEPHNRALAEDGIVTLPGSVFNTNKEK